MIVHLAIDGKEIKLPLNIGGPRELPCIATRTRAKVSAELELEAGDVPGTYVLCVGKDSDVIAYTDVFEGEFKKRFVYYTIDDNNQPIPHWKFELFRVAWGESELFLKKEDRPRPWPIAQIYAELDKDDRRGVFYDEMAKWLLERGLPHFVQNDFKWQMVRNKFSIKWRDGYASRESCDVMLMVIGRVIRRELKPLLTTVNASPQMAVVNTRRRRNLSQISRLDGKTIREIGAVMSRSGAVTVGRMEECIVSEGARLATYNTPAHAVIANFLRGFLGDRLEIIRLDLKRRVQESERDVTMRLQNVKTHDPSRFNPSSHNLLTEAQSVLESLLRKKRYRDEIDRMVRGMLAYPMFAQCRERVTIYDVGEEAFSSNDVYRRLYRLMGDYMRRRFWWVSDRTVSRSKIPEMTLGDDGETRLQYKYSIVYENWCYARLVVAAEKLGFVYDARHSTPWGLSGDNVDKASCAIFRKEGIEIEIRHGITALKRTKRPRSKEFVNWGQRKRGKLTPDFAIIIRCLDHGLEEWIVADAKSDGSLRPHMVNARNDQAMIKYGTKEPLASILFRSGEADGAASGIEIPPPPLGGAALANAFKDGDNDHTGDGYHWDSEQGIVEGDEDPPPYHGHVRVNVGSAARGRDVFEEFLRGMVRTVERMASR